MASLQQKKSQAQAQAKTKSDPNCEQIPNLYEILEIEKTAQIQDGRWQQNKCLNYIKYSIFHI